MISIIIPCYNGHKYIKKCLDSVLSQDYKDIDVVIINDGSTDNSAKIIKPYLKDKRFRYFENENQGIGKTRNFGISKAKGDYIMFLDIDDYLNEKAVSKMVEFALENDLDLTVSDYYVKGLKESYFKINDFGITSARENPNIILDINLAPWGKLYKKNLINDIKFEEDLKYEDAPFVIKSIIKANKVGKLNYASTFYVVNENSETTIRDDRVFDIIEITGIIRKLLDDDIYLETLKKLTVRILTNYTIQQRVNVNPEDGYSFIREAFSYLRIYVPDYKNNKYYSGRGFLRRTIEKSEFLTIIYCKIYQWLHK